MTRATGILRAFGTIVLSCALLALMFWLIGQPSLVLWWRAEYLMAGFVALLMGAVLLARRRSKQPAAATTGAASSLVRAIGIVTGAVLLLIVLYVVAS